jgi:hypothetical protein
MIMQTEFTLSRRITIFGATFEIFNRFVNVGFTALAAIEIDGQNVLGFGIALIGTEAERVIRKFGVRFNAFAGTKLDRIIILGFGITGICTHPKKRESFSKVLGNTVAFDEMDSKGEGSRRISIFSCHSEIGIRGGGGILRTKIPAEDFHSKLKEGGRRFEFFAPHYGDRLKTIGNVFTVMKIGIK